jgi:dTMP kinase
MTGGGERTSARASGYFVVLEGPEGSGKSTQARLLAEAIRAAGYDPLVTREPGGTAIGEQVRRILLDPENCAMLAETEALLIAAARAQHVAEVIRPALESGQVVVCDRYVDSTLAYQGGGRGLPRAALEGVQVFATGGLVPDLRVLLDLPVEQGLARRLGGPDEVNRLDLADVEFHRRVRAAYLELAAADPAGWVVVDAARPVALVSRAVSQVVLGRLPAP